jgi:two-component system OmpR family response regulator
MRLLLIEDDALLGEGLADYLRSEGHQVDWFATLAPLRTVAQEPYDAWLVDWNLPDGSGLQWLASQRARGQTTPAIMLTARDRLADRIDGLDGGADDYLVKPFAPEELAARVRVLARRQAGGAGALRQFGPVQVDLAARAVQVDGVRADLTAREWGLLEALVLRAGRIVTKPELDALANGFDGESSSNALEVHISNLRRKLGRALIETVRGLGYRVPK